MLEIESISSKFIKFIQETESIFFILNDAIDDKEGSNCDGHAKLSDIRNWSEKPTSCSPKESISSLKRGTQTVFWSMGTYDLLRTSEKIRIFPPLHLKANGIPAWSM